MTTEMAPIAFLLTDRWYGNPFSNSLVPASVKVNICHWSHKFLCERYRICKKYEPLIETEKRSHPAYIAKPKETTRVTELSKMLKNGLITDEEFKILNKASKVNPD